MEGKALKKRGYNQSKYLATILGDLIEKNVMDCLKKIKLTDDQIGLGKDKRWNNLQNSFMAKENNKFKDFYYEIILLLKQFILINYKQDFNSKTEAEIIEFLEVQEISTEFKKSLQNFGNNAIIIKFSKNNIAKENLKSDLDYIINLIKSLDSLNKSNKSEVSGRTT